MVQPTLIRVAGCNCNDKDDVKMDREVRRISTHSILRSTSIQLFLILTTLTLLVLTSSTLVHSARSRRDLKPPVLEHLSLTPLRLTSLRYSENGKAVTPSSSSSHHRIDEFVLMRLYFDRTIRTHTVSSVQEMSEIVNISCKSGEGMTTMQISQWNEDENNEAEHQQHQNPLSLVLPLTSTWLQYFHQDDIYDSDNVEDDNNVITPRGNLYDHKIPFATNEFTILFTSAASDVDKKKTSLIQRMKGCTIEMDTSKIVKMKDAATTTSSSSLLRASLAPQKTRRRKTSSPSRRRPTQTIRWHDQLRTTRWIMPAPPASPASSTSDSSPLSCEDELSSQRLIFLENGVSMVGAVMAPVAAAMMSPLQKQFAQTSPTQTAEQIAKNYVTTLTGSIPPEVSNHVSEHVAKGATEIVMDLLATSLTDSVSSSIAGSLGAYLTRSVSADVGDIVREHVQHATTQLISPEISRRIAASVTKLLPNQVVNDVTLSVTQTLVGSLTRSLSGFNHLQSLCRQCALYQHRCEDCAYVKDVARSTSAYSAQYSHYYAKYYAQYYAKVAEKMQVKENDQGTGEAEIEALGLGGEEEEAPPKSKGKGKK